MAWREIDWTRFKVLEEIHLHLYTYEHTKQQSDYLRASAIHELVSKLAACNLLSERARKEWWECVVVARDFFRRHRAPGRSGAATVRDHIYWTVCPTCKKIVSVDARSSDVAVAEHIAPNAEEYASFVCPGSRKEIKREQARDTIEQAQCDFEHRA